MDSIKLEPYMYIHILDLNTNLKRLEEGPKTLFKLDHEEITLAPTKMIKLAPTSYVIIQNPIVLDAHRKPVHNADGSYKNRFGEQLIKTSDKFADPFPLYPDEVLIADQQKFVVIGKDEALLIEVLRDYKDAKGVERHAGDLYQITGPMTYTPIVEEKSVRPIKATTIIKNQGLILEAAKSFKDRKGVPRYAGETWLFTDIGSFIPDVNEIIKKVVKGVVLDNKKALHLLAIRDFIDVTKQQRRVGDEWIVTNDQVQTYIEGVNEKIVAQIKPLTLTSREYVTIENPYDSEGKPQWGKKEIRIGEATFFLQPKEKLIGDIEKIQVLDENSALILEATDDFFDEEFNVHRRARENWIVKGPREYRPNINVAVKRTEKAIALDSNEGVYIRDLITGSVRAVIGEKILLKVSRANFRTQRSSGRRNWTCSPKT